MFAKVTKAFSGRPDSESTSRMIEVGEVLSGDLATVAVREKWAKEVPPNSKSEEAPESDLAIELGKKTVEELKTLAADQGVDLGEATKKADIIAAIELASKAQ